MDLEDASAFSYEKNVRERKRPFSPLGRSRSEGRKPKKLAVSTRKQRRTENRAALSLSKKPKSAVVARKQRYAGLWEMCCGTRVRGSVPQPQSSSLALPCQILVSVDGCQSLAAFGSCIHWMRAPFRRPITPVGGSASCTSTFLTL